MVHVIPFAQIQGDLAVWRALLENFEIHNHLYAGSIICITTSFFVVRVIYYFVYWRATLGLFAVKLLETF